MVNDHAKIMAQMPNENIGEEESVNRDILESNVTLEIEEDEPVEESWVTKLKKR